MSEQVETQIKRLRVDEISLVDEPANLVPGWQLTKSTGDTMGGVMSELDRMIKDADDSEEALTKGHEDLAALLDEANNSYLASAPEPVQSWAASLSEWLRANPDTDGSSSADNSSDSESNSGDEVIANKNVGLQVLHAIRDLFTRADKARSERMDKALEDNWEAFSVAFAKALVAKDYETMTVAVQALRAVVENAAEEVAETNTGDNDDG